MKFERKLEEEKKRFVKMVMTRANEISKRDLAIQPTTQHLVLALLEQLAESFLSHQMAAARIHNLEAELEALRGASENELRVVN